MQSISLSSLTTERLLLRQLQSSDEEAIFALRSNEQVNAFIQRPLATDISDAREFISSINEGVSNKHWLYWAMILKKTQQLIGTVCLWHFANNNSIAEVGYEMLPPFQGAGLMQEALQEIVSYCFTTLHLETIEAYTQPANKKSVQLLVKNNFMQDVNSNIANKEVRFTLQKNSSINADKKQGFKPY